MNATTADAAVITAWTAVSPFGLDRESFVDGLRAGRTAVAEHPLEGSPEPVRTATVPGFDVRELLGKKGTRSMDRLTGLAVWAIGQVTGDRPADVRDDTGLVLGTMGSLQSTMDFTRPSFVEAKPYFVDPGAMANSITNAAAGRCAIWHRLAGPNVTLAAGRVAGLSALNYAVRLLRTGRTRSVLVGAVEECSPARSWIERLTGQTGPLGEGCVILRVEPADAAEGRPVLAEVLAVRSRVALAGDFAGTLRSCVDDVLVHAGVAAEDVTAVSWSGVPGAGEWTVLPGVGAGSSLGSLFGDTGAASALFQVAEVLATAGPEGGYTIVGTADREGMVACALLKTVGRPS
jgi:3-oxoacyl-[acyl-carrier-protein] synthase II